MSFHTTAPMFTHVDQPAGDRSAGGSCDGPSREVTEEAVLRTFVEDTSVPMAMLDRRMCYLAASPAWHTDYALHEAELRGRSHYDVFPEISAEWRDVHRRALSGETIRREEDRFDRPGGTQWLRWEVRPWHHPDGRVGGIVIVTEDITRRKTMEAALVEETERLRELAAHLDRVRENERARIAHEIHDDLGSILSSIRMHLEAARSIAAERGMALPEPIAAIDELLSAAWQGVRRIIADLRPDMLDHLGVWSAIEWLAEQVSAESGMDCTVSVSREAEEAPLTADCGTAIFRIVQEGLTNIVRHAGAKHAAVHAAAEDGTLLLEIRDDGKGFHPRELARRDTWGIAGMTERARRLGGELSLAARPSGGSRLLVRLPLDTERTDGGSSERPKKRPGGP